MQQQNEEKKLINVERKAKLSKLTKNYLKPSKSFLSKQSVKKDAATPPSFHYQNFSAKLVAHNP